MEWLPVFSEFFYCPIIGSQKKWKSTDKCKKSKTKISQKSIFNPKPRIE